MRPTWIRRVELDRSGGMSFPFSPRAALFPPLGEPQRHRHRGAPRPCLAEVLPFEKLPIVATTNGARLRTYTIASERGSGCICNDGAAAHLVRPGDEGIMMTFEATDRSRTPNALPIGEGNCVGHKVSTPPRSRSGRSRASCTARPIRRLGSSRTGGPSCLRGPRGSERRLPARSTAQPARSPDGLTPASARARSTAGSADDAPPGGEVGSDWQLGRGERRARELLGGAQRDPARASQGREIVIFERDVARVE